MEPHTAYLVEYKTQVRGIHNRVVVANTIPDVVSFLENEFGSSELEILQIKKADFAVWIEEVVE